MNILILGSGGREHALAWKLQQSPLCSKLWVAPGNAGTDQIAENVALAPDDFTGIRNLVATASINMVVVGPEGPLAAGITDYLSAAFADLLIIGPSKAGALLEGSKDFAKTFMNRYNIPTAAYQSFTADSLVEGKAFLATLQAPYVLKSDGLCGGKGVIIEAELNTAQNTLEALLVGRKFGQASDKVVIEAYLNGIEMSCFVLTDGASYVTLPSAKDYKRIGEGDTGLNTGGMGAVSPPSFLSPKLMAKIEADIIKPTVAGLQQEGIDYCGFIFFGLMIIGDDPFVIEYNVRLGDPETEVILPRITSDLLVLLRKAALKEGLTGASITEDPDTAATVMLVSEGYPEAYATGKPITLPTATKDSIIFHAGTSVSDGEVLTAGGRVLTVTAKAKHLQEALDKSYQTIKAIAFEGKTFRADIGQDLLSSTTATKQP